MPDQDIFDRVAAKMGGGDIFDRLAAKMPSPEQQTISQLPNPAMQAHQQSTQQGTNLMGASGYPELANARPSGPSLGKGGQPPGTPDVQGTLNTLPALGGTVGTAAGGPVGAALGGGAGEATKQLIQRAAGEPVTQTPATDIGKQAAIMGAAEGVGKYVLGPAAGFIGKQLGKFSGRPASEIAELTQLPQREEAIRQRLVEGYKAARSTASAAYPQITTPVNMAGAREVAQEGAESIVAHGTPRLVGQVAGTVDKGTEFLKVAGNYQAAMGENLADPAVIQGIAKNLSNNTPVPFRDAQQVYSALGEAIAKGHGRLPGEVYGPLKAVRDSIFDGMKEAAQADGKLAQFTKAQKGFQQLMDDWKNPGAPMKQPMSGASKTQGTLMGKFVGSDGARIANTMDKYGVETRDIRAFMQQGQKMAKGKIADARELARMGQPAFQAQAGQQAKMDALKKGLALAGGGGLIYDLLKRSRPVASGPR